MHLDLAEQEEAVGWMPVDLGLREQEEAARLHLQDLGDIGHLDHEHKQKATRDVAT